ncbi:MAG: TIGR03643 family protein [Bdellovibrionaceae bacterium]|nr:TIGR03643 family protein [Pseudobdellovibrionaceae bacterium]NUM59768.1 TIGR03643 family protein [Pseudobdellovibrionaceae bacterium]
MGISNNLKKKIATLTPNDIDRIVRMGWEDRTTFESIAEQFLFSENELVRVMRRQLSHSVFCRWRKRIHNQGHLKHETKRGFKTTRFKCSRQTIDGLTKGWK